MVYKEMYKKVKKESNKQIRILRGRVAFLRKENHVLRKKYKELQKRVDEPEKLLNPFTENVVEIAWEYAVLTERYPELTDIDSTNWKQLFADWGMEFEMTYLDEKFWDDHDYLDYISEFARKKILEYAGVSEKEVAAS